MPEQRQYRYPGIQPFTGQQKDLFFGRDEDQEQLLSLLLLERLTVLFGKSGYGKSSLLQAGIAPRLERETQRGKRTYTPVFIRFHSRLGNEQYNWFDWFSFHLEQQVPGLNPKTPAGVPKSIWGELKRRETETNQVFILIFDQFEEIFTYPPDQIEALKNQLADLLYADIPEYLEENEDAHSEAEVAWLSQKVDARVVIAIRADRLSELDQLKNTLPAILNKRYELRALTQEQAREALEKPAARTGDGFLSPTFSWYPDALEKLLTDLAHNRQGRDTGIEAFQLQVLAQHVENRVIQGLVPDRNGDGTPDVTLSDLPNLDRLYENFYEDSINKLASNNRKKAQRLLEQGLIFEADNQRINLHEKLIQRDYKADTALIQQLIGLRLLRAEPSTSGGRNIELSHDAFVLPILNSARRRKHDMWKRRAKFSGALAMLCGFIILLSSLFSMLEPAEMPSLPSAQVVQENLELVHEVDSLRRIQAELDSVRAVILTYVDCVNRHDIECCSAIMTDTLVRYHRVDSLPRLQREKLDRDYYRRHAGDRIAEVSFVTVEKVGENYEASMNVQFQYERKGTVPVIYQIKLNSDRKIFYLRSLFVKEETSSSNHE